jgi:hypothetical protein
VPTTPITPVSANLSRAFFIGPPKNRSERESGHYN